MRGPLVVLAVVLLVPGCVQFAGLGGSPSGAPQAIDFDAIERAIGTPIVEDHDHADGALHGHSYNLELVALTNGRKGGDWQPTEVYWETAVKDGYAYLTRSGPEAGLVIFDVHDLARPEQIGYIHLEAGFEPDIEVSDDGKWAFWETQRFPTSVQTPSLDHPGANAPRGVHIIDVSDKTNPRWAGFSPTTPDGPHSITYANIDGRHILFQSVYAFAYAYFDAEVPGAQRLVITELDTSGPTATLRTLAEYSHPEAVGSGKMPHDVSVQKHPLTGQWLAYVAYWDLGVVILDVTDPANPALVGRAADFGPAPYGAIHMARAFPHLIAGRHVTVAEPEIGGQPDSGYLTFFDTTDPANPLYISSWKLPGNLTSAGGTLGPHYFDVADGRVALASYHAGFWVIDVHNRENLLRPRAVAFAEVSLPLASVPGPLGLGRASNAFDAWWYDGHLVGGDMGGGLAVYRYLGPAPAPVTRAP